MTEEVKEKSDKEKSYRPLFLVDNAEGKKKLQEYCKGNTQLSQFKAKNKFIYTTLDKFKNKGQQRESFDFCIYFSPDCDASSDSGDEMESLFQYIKAYFVAPICGVVRKDMGLVGKAEMNKTLSEVNAKGVKYCYYKKEEEIAAEINKCLDACKEAYKKELKDKVTPMFEKIDKDESGSIDTQELKDLLESMDQKISDEELKSAMEDLDLDGDGTISLEEFSLWYFSGMKPYGKGKKALLNLGKNSKDALKSLGGGSLEAMDLDKLKMHYQKLSFRYNKPQDIGSQFSAQFWLYGPKHLSIQKELTQKYDKTLGSHYDKFYLPFIEIKIHQNQKCEAIVRNIKKCYEDIYQLMMKLYERDENKQWVAPVITCEGSNKCVRIGMKFPTKKKELAKKAFKYGIPQKYRKFIEGADQGVKFDIKTGTSFGDLMKGEQLVAEELNKGFEIDIQIAILSNIKAVCLEKLNDDNLPSSQQQQWGLVLLITLIQTSVDVDFEFKSFKDVMRNPFLKKHVKTIAQYLGEPDFKTFYSKILRTKIDVDSIPDDVWENHSSNEKMKLAPLVIKLIHSLFDALDNMDKKGSMEVQFYWPDLGSAQFQIKSNLMGKAFILMCLMYIAEMLEEKDMMNKLLEARDEAGEYIYGKDDEAESNSD